MYRVRVERHSGYYSSYELSRLMGLDVAHGLNYEKPYLHEVITAVFQFPRSVLAEVITHRLLSQNWDGVGEGVSDLLSLSERTTTLDLSKNSASSRAIPYSKMREKVLKDPYMPAWTMNQSGMQGAAAEQEICAKADQAWLRARDLMLTVADELTALGIHKQDANRLTEPMGWTEQVITGTRAGWNNFFGLRCHKAAHPAFRHAARMLYLAFRKSKPTMLEIGQWHLPFVDQADAACFEYVPDMAKLAMGKIPEIIRFSAANCARVSYNKHDVAGTAENREMIWNKLVAEVPRHASPVEHQCTPMRREWVGEKRTLSNFFGWLQARKLLPDENIDEFNPSEEEIASWGIDETKLWVEE